MSRYYFHVKRGQVTVLDQEGLELPNVAGAEREAVRRAQHIFNGEAMKGVPGSNKMIIVADDNWQTLFGLPF